MKRRSFLAMLGLAPAVAVAARSLPTNTVPAAAPEAVVADARPFVLDARPFVLEAGELKMNTVYFESLRSADGRLVITPGQFTITA